MHMIRRQTIRAPELFAQLVLVLVVICAGERACMFMWDVGTMRITTIGRLASLEDGCTHTHTLAQHTHTPTVACATVGDRYAGRADWRQNLPIGSDKFLQNLKLISVLL